MTDQKRCKCEVRQVGSEPNTCARCGGSLGLQGAREYAKAEDGQSGDEGGRGGAGGVLQASFTMGVGGGCKHTRATSLDSSPPAIVCDDCGKTLGAQSSTHGYAGGGGGGAGGSTSGSGRGGNGGAGGSVNFLGTPNAGGGGGRVAPPYERGGPDPEMFPGVAGDTAEIMPFFEYSHLPPHLQEVSAPFALIANTIVASLPACRERTKALDRLLEAKDCAVRAKLSGAKR